MPNLDELDGAMLQPARWVPAIHRLGGGTILMAAADQPWRVAGRSAVVYQLRQPGGRVIALRCLFAEGEALDPDLEGRYRGLASATVLAPLRQPDGPLATDLNVFPRGLAFPARDLRSSIHPLIAMGWVMGPTLLAAADRACRARDSASLDLYAESWATAVAALTSVGFSHGDLAADNALVRPGGGIALIDYDTVAWPGSPPPPGSPERAVGEAAAPGPGYAHPSGKRLATERRDDYPALIMYASLRILALRSDLRAHYGDPPGRAGGVLLFTATDLATPNESPLFETLRDLNDPSAQELIGVIREASSGRPSSTPPLAEVVSRLRRAARRARPIAWPPTAPTVPATASTPPASWPEPHPSPPPPTSVAGTWPIRPMDAAPAKPPPASLAERSPPPLPPSDQRPTSASATPAMSDAPERQRRLTRLNSLLLAGDDDGALRLWLASGFGRDPEALRDLGPRLVDVQLRQSLRRARHAAEIGDSLLLLRLWRDANLEAYQPAASLVPVVEAAQRRRGLTEQLRKALDRDDERTVLRLWPELRGDPLASHLAIPAQALLADVAGAAVAAAVADGSDEAILASLAEAEANGIAMSAAARHAQRAASDRLRTRRALAQAVADDDRTTLADLALSGRLGEIGQLAPVAMRAVLRALAWPHLARALAADDDTAILAAADDDLFGDAGALSPEERGRVDLAGARVQWHRDVRVALRERDVAVLRSLLTKPPAGAEVRLSRVERSRIERLTTRETAVSQLTRALREGPDRAILEALAGVEAAGAPLPSALDWAAVRGVVDRVTLADAIREAAAAEPPDYARLARLLPAARAAMIDGGVGLGPDIDFARLEADVLAAAQLDRLHDLLASGDDEEIAIAVRADPHNLVARLSAPEQARVEQALRGRRH